MAVQRQTTHPFVTGFCSVGNHQFCRGVIRQTIGDAYCTCTCHALTDPSDTPASGEQQP